MMNDTVPPLINDSLLLHIISFLLITSDDLTGKDKNG